MAAPQADGAPSGASDAVVASPIARSAVPATLHDAPAHDQPNARLAAVLRGFVAAFSASNPNESVVHIALAPGRVNLIGEHIDYEGYSVLPMAIAQSMAVAVASSPSSSIMRIANTNPAYATATIVLRPPPDAVGDALFQLLTASLTSETAWARYVLCGYMAVLEWAPASLSLGSLDAFQSMDVLVDGAVPPARGLASSSALVVASALALASSLCPHGRVLPTRTQLAERCRYAEQYVGTAGGGMDQAVSCLATAHAALFVAFEPQLHVASVPLPGACRTKHAVVVVVDSGVVAHKAQDAPARFNKRVVECALATKLLGKRLGLTGWETMTTLRQLQRALEDDRGERPVTFGELLDVVATIGDTDEYSRDALATELGDLVALFVGSRLAKAATEVLRSESRFKLWQRARHVWSEAGRVEQFRELLLLAASEMQPDEQLQRLGALMLASHASCRDDYECSCPELDTIVETAQQAGAYGARLTGAGWGGCAVVLVPADRVPSLRATLEAKVFEHNTPEDAMFESTAGTGARLFTVSP